MQELDATEFTGKDNTSYIVIFQFSISISIYSYLKLGLQFSHKITWTIHAAN